MATITERLTRLVDTIGRLNEDIGKWERDVKYSERTKQGQIKKLSAERDRYMSGVFETEIVEDAQKKFNRISQQRRETFAAAQMADPLTNPVARGDARSRLETTLKGAVTFQDFAKGYDRAVVSGDMYMQRAYQIDGPGMAKQRFPGDPAVGSFEKKMGAHYKDFFASDETRQLDAQLSDLRADLQQAVPIARDLYRGAVGMTGMHAPQMKGPHIDLEKLLWAVSGELGYGYDPGAGGVYTPQSIERVTLGG